MKKKKFESVFTLTELTIAIAVMAVGMVGIMALFAVGFHAAKDTVGDSYSSAMAEQFLHLIKRNCLNYDGNGEYIKKDADGIAPFEAGSDLNGNQIQDWDGWGEWITNTRAPFFNDITISHISTDPPVKENLDIGKVLSSTKAKEIGVLNTALATADGNGDGWDDAGIYFDKDLVGTNNGVFYIEARSNDIIDWDGVMYIWREQIPFDANMNGVANPNDPLELMPYDYAARLCVEISWPFDKPYEQRRKRVYTLEIFNQIDRVAP